MQHITKLAHADEFLAAVKLSCNQVLNDTMAWKLGFKIVNCFGSIISYVSVKSTQSDYYYTNFQITQL